jgi:hypothetical protein
MFHLGERKRNRSKDKCDIDCDHGENKDRDEDVERRGRTYHFSSEGLGHIFGADT